jgi:hypothetical protein
MWFLSGHVAVKLVDTSVPFDSVKRFAIKRKDTLQLYTVTR